MDEGKESPLRLLKRLPPKGVVRGKEVWILRVALGNDAVWVRYASMQEAAEAVKEASNCRHTSIRKIVAKKLNEIPADIGGDTCGCVEEGVNARKSKGEAQNTKKPLPAAAEEDKETRCSVDAVFGSGSGKT